MIAKHDKSGLMEGMVNLCRALYKLGFCSRTDAEKIVRQGRVTVNNTVEKNPRRSFRIESTSVKVDGRPAARDELLCFALNKPVGVLTTKNDGQGRWTVYDIFKKSRYGKLLETTWLFPVGRLDSDTSGLILFTNSTRFAALLAAPETRVTKTYEAKVQGRVTPQDATALVAGISLNARGETFSAKPAEVEILKTGSHETLMKISLTEGKNRQVRRMFNAKGYKVRSLKRTWIGDLGLDDMAAGDCRRLEDHEMGLLASPSETLTRFLAQANRGGPNSAGH